MKEVHTHRARATYGGDRQSHESHAVPHESHAVPHRPVQIALRAMRLWLASPTKPSTNLQTVSRVAALLSSALGGGLTGAQRLYRPARVHTQTSTSPHTVTRVHTETRVHTQTHHTETRAHTQQHEPTHRPTTINSNRPTFEAALETIETSTSPLRPARAH